MVELSRQTAAVHEALYLRLERLTRQVEALALRKPDAPAPAEMLALAEALLLGTRERAVFGIDQRSIMARSLCGLAVELGQMLARLDLFEAAHSAWSAEHNCFVWRLARGVIAPVQRLRPKAVGLSATAEARKNADEMRRRVSRLIDAKVADAYESGYADAQNGLEPDPPNPSPASQKRLPAAA